MKYLLALTLLVGSAAVPLETVARGETDPSARRAFVARDLVEARDFSRILASRDRGEVERVDYGRYHTVAAFWIFPTSGGSVEIRGVRRRGSTVVVRIALTDPPAFARPARNTPTSAYHVVRVSKLALRLPSVPRVVVKPLWETIGRASAVRLRPSRQGGYIAGTLQATQRFALALRAEHRAELFEIDYRRFVVVAPFATLPDCGYAVEIRALKRNRRVLNVVLAVHRAPPGVVFCFAVTTFYHVVKVPRSVLGGPLPRLVIVKRQS